MAKTIFMIHGMWGGGWQWDPFKNYFRAKGFDCEAPYLLYHDVSPDEIPPEELGKTSLLDYAADLESKIKGLDEKPILMGHSMGGLLSLILSGRGLAEAAVLIAPAPPAGIFAVDLSALRTFAGPISKLSWLGRSHRLSFDAAERAILNRISPGERRYLFERSVSDSGRAATEMGFWFLDRRMASRVKPETVKCPLLIVGAGDDRLTPPKVLRKIVRKYNEVAVYKEYPGRAHFIIREEGWEQVAVDIHDWLVERVIR